MKKLVNFQPPEVFSYTSTAITAFQSQPVTSFGKIDNSTSRMTSKKSTHPMLCEICQKSFNSDLQAQQHFTSKAHQSKIRTLSEPIHPGPAGSVVVPSATTKPAEVKLGKNINTELCHCNACNITLNSKSQLKQHNRGLRHKIMTGKASAPPPSYEGNMKYLFTIGKYVPGKLCPDWLKFHFIKLNIKSWDDVPHCKKNVSVKKIFGVKGFFSKRCT